MLLSGCDALPNRGAMGMLKEFDAVDAGGPRSSTTYAYSGFRVNLVNQYVLVAGGYWRPGDERARRSLERVRVGAADLPSPATRLPRGTRCSTLRRCRRATASSMSGCRTSRT